MRGRRMVDRDSTEPGSISSPPTAPRRSAATLVESAVEADEHRRVGVAERQRREGVEVDRHVQAVGEVLGRGVPGEEVPCIVRSKWPICRVTDMGACRCSWMAAWVLGLSSAALSGQAVRWDRVTPPTTPPSLYSPLAYDSARGEVVVFGRLGYGCSGVCAPETWVFNGNTWLRKNPSVSPSSRDLHAMVFDIARNRLILFGGVDSGSRPLGDTWSWDGSSWTRVATSGPAPRFGATMAYDSLRERVVLFGGESSGTTYSVTLQDTWEWDGTRWLAMQASSRPPARVDCASAFDAARGQTVIFGGSSTASVTALIHDMWGWDGTSWTQLRPASLPPARNNPAMVWDTWRERVVLFGGGQATGLITDVWEWDGSWVLRLPSGAGPAQPAGAAFDSRRGRTVTFGGWSSTETWEYGPLLPAQCVRYGAGCRGSNGVPALDCGSLPWANSQLTLGLGNAPPSTPVIGVFGASRSSWGQLSLPAAIAGTGGCMLLTSVELALPAMTDPTGAAGWRVRVPNIATLVGVSYFGQGLVADALANPTGIVASNGLVMTVGLK